MEHLFFVFPDHTQRRSTVGRTPLDEWSARRRDLYLTTHDTHNRQISMPPWDSKPRSQQVSGLWPLTCWDCPCLSFSYCHGICSEVTEEYQWNIQPINPISLPRLLISRNTKLEIRILFWFWFRKLLAPRNLHLFIIINNEAVTYFQQVLLSKTQYCDSRAACFTGNSLVISLESLIILTVDRRYWNWSSQPLERVWIYLK